MIYTTYAPAGISEEAVTEHLQDIQEYVRLFAPHARLEMLQVFG